MRLFRLVPFFLTFSLFAQQLDTRAIDSLMQRTIEAWNVPGAAIAIVQNDRVVYVKGFGVKELGGTDKVTPDTLFQIASTSKAFTSTALAMLATDGKLSFDDPVRKHVEYFRLGDACADANVMLRDIVSHRTGAARHDELWDDTELTREDVIRAMAHFELSRPFRTTYQYQNIMFIAAGEAVAHASGVSWDDFVRTRIFQPLAMANTVTTDEEWAASKDRAAGHKYDWKARRISLQKPIDTTTIGAGGAIKSSARDMGNWIRFQLANGSFDGRQLVDPEQLAETKTPHTVIRMGPLTRDSNPETNVMTYGMGWNIQDYRGEQFVAHTGSLSGFRTQVVLLPKRNAGFVLLINAARGIGLFALRNTLADMLTGKPSRDWNEYYLKVDRAADERSEKEKTERLAKRIPNTTPTHPLAEYAGEYEHRAYGPLRVSLVDGGLVLQWARIRAPLTHFHYDVFLAEEAEHDVDERVTFSVDDEKKVKSLTIFGERFARRGQ